MYTSCVDLWKQFFLRLQKRQYNHNYIFFQRSETSFMSSWHVSCIKCGKIQCAMFFQANTTTTIRNMPLCYLLLRYEGLRHKDIKEMLPLINNKQLLPNRWSYCLCDELHCTSLYHFLVCAIKISIRSRLKPKHNCLCKNI